ncbi:MAG: glutamine--fructose-6-phosphate aminotransferase [isomerizing] [Deltaproteobacteria bacterium]|jgi:glucosamine--fructose-6-phosphate aminotransferase (isomerizing)|nr:MAG: glutamine--fructose-6-phosphate aminotransferase [isomerizing] [Deltaproteobacteria bacterium]
MCGIIAYIGKPDKTLHVLIEGLKRLEYRGYDSAGIAVLGSSGVRIVKSEGKLLNLLSRLEGVSLSGSSGLGHTRWATHGVPSERNAHPHVSGKTVVVHNGIIENYQELKDELKRKGYHFNSDTDTEVIAHLIEDFSLKGFSLEESVRKAFKLLEGTYAVAVISEREPDKVVGIRKFLPLILAIGDGEVFLASDIPAVLPFTRNVVLLEDGDIAILEKNRFRITDSEGREVKRDIFPIDWDPITVEKGGYKHFMLKEIHEQPQAVLDTIRGRVFLEEGRVFFKGVEDSWVADVNRIVAIGCGTSYHACLVGRYMIEKLSRIPVDVDLASEFRYREPVVDEKTLVIAVSQSGETADTSYALLEAKRRGAKTLAITNVFGSKIARESDVVIYTHAGPEIGVASTKSFTTQLVVFYLLSLFLGISRNRLTDAYSLQLIKDILALPQLLQHVLRLDSEISVLAGEFYKYKNFIYLGRGLNYPIALEGALKLKEVSYIHAEGYAAGEMKHGPIALIDEKMPVVVVAPQDELLYRKLVGNIQEVKTRKGRVILLTSKGSVNEFYGWVDRFVEIPKTPYLLSPLISVVPLQLLAYYIASYRGTDIDQPRNLAKVVTVE